MDYITEVKNESSLLDKMREQREISTAAFIMFTDLYKKQRGHVFCFYEGEDGKYYNQRITSILGCNIVPIICGNKKETLKIWRRLKDDPYYSEIKKMFFVDRDMDDTPEDLNKDLYITPCYSIENLYANKDSFEKILQSEFSLNKFENDFRKCTDKFDALFEQFNNEMIEFNALVLIRKNKNLGNGSISLSNIKTNQLVTIELTGIKRSAKYEEKISDLISKLHISQEELNDAIKEIRSKGDFKNIFRGKNQLDFMIVFLRNLIKAQSEQQFFEEKKNCVHLNPTANRLSELSQYAVSPSCLIAFIKAHSASI